MTDGSGTVVYSEAYDLHGGIQKTWVNTYDPKLKFSGKERDGDTGLNYFGARYYGYSSYRFISVDPVISREEAISNPQLWNLYSYCRNNPVTFVDPDGEASIVAPYNPGLNRHINAKIAAFINNAWLPKFAKSLLISLLHQPETREEFAIEFSTTVLGFAGVIESGVSKSILKAGVSKSNYRKLFVESFPDMRKYYHVHHILPQKYELILSKAGINVHKLKYLRGIPPEIHSKITKLWLGWGKSFGRTPTAKEIMSYAKEIGKNFGKYFY